MTDVAAGNYYATVEFYQASATWDAQEFSLGVYTYEEVDIHSDDGFINTTPDFHIVENYDSNLNWI